MTAIPKSKQLAYRTRRRRTAAGVEHESDLQKFTNDYLGYKQIRYVRIPDEIFRWVRKNTSVQFQKWFCWTFRALPDNLCLISAGDYTLALCLELKSGRGQTHGRQKSESRKLNWHICRTPEQVQATVDEFERAAQALQRTLGRVHDAGTGAQPDKEDREAGPCA